MDNWKPSAIFNAAKPRKKNIQTKRNVTLQRHSTKKKRDNFYRRSGQPAGSTQLSFYSMAYRPHWAVTKMELYENAFNLQTGLTCKRRSLVSVWTENILKNDDVMIIMWFSWPSLPQVALFNSPGVVWTENFCCVKPRPNDRTMPTQHAATLLNTTCCVAFGHRVAMCCDRLGVVG